MRKGEGAAKLIGQLGGLAFGWVFCMALLAGAYFLGHATAGFFSGNEHREAFGLLSALALVWMYEHELSDDRWTKLFSRDA